MRHLAIIAIMLIIGSAAVHPAVAATFYVDPVAGSMSNDGSQAHPWSTLQAVFSGGKIQSKNSSGGVINPSGPVKAGDTLLLRSGYHGDINVSNYYNDAVITVAAEPGQTPALRRLSVSGFKNWVFDGLTISPELSPTFAKITQVNIAGTSSYVTIQNCHCYSVDSIAGYTAAQWVANTGDGISVGSSCHHVSILNNIVRNTAFGINLSGTYLLARGNQVINFRGDGMRAINDNQTLEYNVIKNCFKVDDNHDDGIQCWKIGTISGNIFNMVLRGNLIINTEDPNQPLQGTLQGVGFFDGQHINFLVENNVVIVDHWHGITLLGAENCTVINNTAYNPRWISGASTLKTWIQIGANKDGTLATNNVIRNNLSHSFVTGGNVNLAYDHNLAVSQSNYASLFVDPQHGDFHLKAGSAAIDAGSPVGAPTIDFERHARPAGTAWDLGAYEFGTAAAGPPVAFAGENQLVADPDGDGLATVTLNGSASYAPGGSITSWTWTEGATVIGAGATIQVSLPLGEHAITLTVTNAATPPQADTDMLTVTVATSVPVDSTLAWQSFAMANQAGRFAVEFDARPNAAAIDTCFGLSLGAADAYADLACIFRFYTNGRMDVRNGAAYAADVTAPYTAGTWYHVRMVIDITTKRYSVTVTPAGGSEIALAANYAFRSEQSAVAALDHWAFVNTTTEGMSVEHLTVGPPAPPLTVTGWAVQATHGAAGTFVTPLADGACEPRRAGLRKIEITLSRPLNAATALPTAMAIAGQSHGNVSSLVQTVTVLPAGNVLAVELSSPLPDGDVYTVTITATLKDADGQSVSGDADLSVRVLAGDVDASGTVTPADILAARSAAGRPLTAATARYDVDSSGAITGSDLLAIRSCLGH